MTDPYAPITLSREVEAVLIPAGSRVTLPEGSVVYVTQSLGGSFTVNINGNLARIAGTDADALGLEVPEEAKAGEPVGELTEDRVWQVLATVYDPEIPIDIVNLGLIYGVRIEPLERGGNRVVVRMTLTAPGCGIGELLVNDIRERVGALPDVDEVEVELTFDPPWNQSMMSEEARLQTGMY